MREHIVKGIAVSQINDLERAMHGSSALIRKFRRSVAESAVDAVRKGQKTVGTLEPSEEVKEELVDLMAFSYLTRIRLDRKTRRRSLGLSTSFRRDVNKMARSFDLDLVGLKTKFKKISDNSLKASMGSIRDAINTELTKSVVDKTSLRTAKNRVLRKLKTLGVAPGNAGLIETLVRTHSQLAYNGAHWMQYQGDPDLWGFQYHTAGDDRVRPEHEKLDGMRRKKDDGIWQTVWPPNGWNCRCQVVAIYDKMRQTPIPKSLVIDPAFAFNPAELLA